MRKHSHLPGESGYALLIEFVSRRLNPTQVLTPSGSLYALIDRHGITLTDHWGTGVYFLAEALKTAIVAINQLPQTEETLWLRILGKGSTQQQAINEVIALTQGDIRRSRTLRLLANWKINIETSGAIDEEEQELLMTLSQAYLEWEQATEQKAMEQGIQQGIEAERRAAIVSLLTLRYGQIDDQLAGIIPALIELPSEDYTRLILQSSREELLSHWTQP